MATKQSVNKYYRLSKPGIIYANLMTAAAGFLLAAKGDVAIGLLLVSLLGLGFIIASGCAINNYIDRDIDGLMMRTRQRAIVRGAISGRAVALFSAALGLIGVAVLGLLTNYIALLVAVAGFVIYVGVYTPLKRKSVHSTILGSLSGAVAPVVGYAAATGRLDGGAGLLFLVLVLWQMPHFYAIGIYRLRDYRAAGLPILPVQKGLPTTRLYMVIYIVGFIVATWLLALSGYTGAIYLIIMTLVGFGWLRLALAGFKPSRANAWARQVFGFSLIALTVFSVMISIDSFLV